MLQLQPILRPASRQAQCSPSFDLAQHSRFSPPNMGFIIIIGSFH
ncbi:hypothetical protein GGQ95_000789 [Anoxybacillus rupiensis]|nr:hypothetical protein [Anoxybacillus rupiensis]